MVQLDNIKAGNTVQTVKAPTNTATAQADISSTDSVSKDIQGKIQNAQKQSQALSLNTEMTAQERETKRQQIQQEISDLKRELRLREAEKKKKQEEAKKAEAQKEEQQKEASRKAIMEQTQNTQSSQDTNTRQQGNISESGNSRQTEDSNTDGEVREILSDGLHKIISTDSNVQQYRIVQNVSAQINGTYRIQESEINQDAARGADVTKLKETQHKALQKETQRMEMMQEFIFGNKNNNSAQPAIGVRNQLSQDSRESGLYNSNGTIFQNNFQSMQMDITLSGI